jgi:hypothetical protein
MGAELGSGRWIKSSSFPLPNVLKISTPARREMPTANQPMTKTARSTNKYRSIR